MLKEAYGSQNLIYEGTIIDIETIGNYRSGSPKHDSRIYEDLKMVIFGYINKQEWHIYCAAGIKDIPKLEEKAKQLLIILRKERPLYAFNCHQEMGVFFHRLNEKILIDKELQSEEYERKEEALRKLGIMESYDDPFHMDQKPGRACMIAWEKGYFDKAVQHNRACLLKEQALLLHGRGREPEPLYFKTETIPTVSPRRSYEPYSKEEDNDIRKAWRDGNTVKTIADDCKRTSNAIWIRLQRLGEISTEVPYTIEKDSLKVTDLQH